MSEFIRKIKIDTNECPNIYLWPIYSNIRIYSSHSDTYRICELCELFLSFGLSYIFYFLFTQVHLLPKMDRFMFLLSVLAQRGWPTLNWTINTVKEANNSGERGNQGTAKREIHFTNNKKDCLQNMRNIYKKETLKTNNSFHLTGFRRIEFLPICPKSRVVISFSWT